MGPVKRTEGAPIDQLRAWLRAGELQRLLAFAHQHRRTLSYLTALTYDPEPLTAWRALDAAGWVAGQAIQAGEIEWVRNHLRRCQWLLSDESGGIGWRAPEMMGEIVARSLDLFGRYPPTKGYEGVRRGNVLGTYLHGPLLPKNTWFADWLVATALGLRAPLQGLDDAVGLRADYRSGRF